MSASDVILESWKKDGKLKEVFDSVKELLKDVTATAKDEGRSKQRMIPCIYRVPDKFRKQNESAYIPRLVSIGPLHKEDEHLRGMVEHKVSYMEYLFHRTTDVNETIRLCMWALPEIVTKARPYYEEKVEPDDVKFAVMMLVDGCFILELLYRFASKGPDYIFGSPSRGFDIRHDLLLLENQIPFLVLQKLFTHTVERIKEDPHHPLCSSLTKLVLSFFGDMMRSQDDDQEVADQKVGCLRRMMKGSQLGGAAGGQKGDPLKDSSTTADHYHHILHLMHRYYMPSCANPGYPPKFKYSASDLESAGIDFEAGEKEDLFKVKFNKSCCFSWLCGENTTITSPDDRRGCRLRRPCCCFSWLCDFCGSTSFKIPPFSISDSTEPFLRNLIAFEQCYPELKERHITSFAYFMDTLINSAMDVELLEKAHVLHNNLGSSEEASHLFNNICNQVVLGKNFYYTKEWNKVQEHRRRSWPEFLAKLRRDYFSNPWAAISVIAALILFALTVVQTIFAIP